MTNRFLFGFLAGQSNNRPSKSNTANQQQIRALIEQNQQLEASVHSAMSVSAALAEALYQENPEHPLVDPFDLNTNPLIQKISDEAYKEVLPDGLG